MLPSVLYELVVVFGVAVVVALTLSRLRLPTAAGYLAAGALIGPSGLRWIEDEARIEALAEIGVVLLLFTIGLEFSMERLRRLARVLVLGGGLQVGLTVLAVAGISVAGGFSIRAGVFFGFLVALSSTAVVLRELSVTGTVDAPHGQVIVGALIFQDLCVVPMMLLVPLLGSGGGSTAQVALVVAKAVALVVATVFLGRLLIPRALGVIARAGRRELFLLGVLLLCVGIAYLTSLTGLSLALGAFLAGLALADSEYRHQALAEVIPFREALTSLFFVSVGMLFQAEVVWRQPLVVIGWASAVIVGKALIAALAALLLRMPPRVAVLAGVGLAQIGEFSFLVAQAGRTHGLLDEERSRVFVAMSVLTLLATPLLLRLGPRLAAAVGRVSAVERLFRTRRLHEHEPVPNELSGHLVIGGYGIGGRIVTGALTASGVPHVVLELDPERVRAARVRGERVFYGDVTAPEILEAAGIHRARAFVVLINDPDAAARAVAAARRLSPDVPIVVRTEHVREVEGLRERGANDVIVTEFEAAVEALARGLRAAKLPEAAVQLHVDRVRIDGIPEVGPVGGPRRMLGVVGGRPVPDERALTPCPHLTEVRDVTARSAGCEECLADGTRWVSLRLCLSCGHVGCCDSSVGRHASGHYAATTHPVMRSAEPGEHWGWCYVDRREVAVPPGPA